MKGASLVQDRAAGQGGPGTPPARAVPRPSRRTAGAIAYYVTASVVAVLFVAPLCWAVVRSLQPEAKLIAPVGTGSFAGLGLRSYRTLLGSGIDILLYVRNSLVVGAGTAILTSIVATMAGYGFARFSFRGINAIFLGLLAIFMVPFQVVVIPMLGELQRLHLANSWLGLILVHGTYAMPFCLFVMRNTFLDVPIELEEAALVDGGSALTIFFRVLRPLVMPGLVSCCLFSFLFSWTEFLGAVTFLSSQNLFTLPVELLSLEVGTNGIVNYGLLEAGAVLTMIPCLVLYGFLQRQYVAGLVAGAVKA
jgi:multiple sugar transport system permease protein